MDLYTVMINTLEKVEVKGADNMDYLLGVINMLKQLREKAREKANAEQQVENTEDKTGGGE